MIKKEIFAGCKEFVEKVINFFVSAYWKRAQICRETDNKLKQ